MNWNLSVAIPLLIGLFLFGIIYAVIVYFLGNRHAGYTSLLVVVGVVVTILGSFQIIGWNNVQWMVIAFTASGVPMIVGDVIKGAKERQKEEAAKLDLLKKIADRGIGEANGCNDETSLTRQ